MKLVDLAAIAGYAAYILRHIGVMSRLMPDRRARSAIHSLSNHQSLQERTYEALRAAILSGELIPGARLYEPVLAERLGVSRSPLREAVRRLQQDGLVEGRPRAGIYVAKVSPEEVEDVYRLRAALEGTAAALAAERMTERELSELQRILDRLEAPDSLPDEVVVRDSDRFHEVIHRGAHSQRLSSLLAQLYGQIAHFRNLTLRVPGRAQQASHGHAALLRALIERDPVAAERLMRDHVDEARRTLLEHFETAALPATEEGSA